MNPTDVIILGVAGLLLAWISYRVGHGSAEVAYEDRLMNKGRMLAEAMGEILKTLEATLLKE